MRLNWISLWPPSAGDGAALSTRLLPELARHADLRVFTVADGADAEPTRFGPALRLDPDGVPWARLQEAECTVYVLCNSAEAAAIWRIARHHRGVVLVASASLGRLLGGLPERDVEARAALQRFVLRVRGAGGLQATGLPLGSETHVAAMQGDYPFADLVSEGALGSVRWGPAAAAARAGDLVLRGDELAADAKRLVAFAARAMQRRAELAASVVMRRAAEEVRGWQGRARGAAAAPASEHVASVRRLLAAFGQRSLGVPPAASLTERDGAEP